MLNSHINQSQSVLNLLLVHKPFLAGGATNHSSSAAYFPTILRQPKATRTGTTSTGKIKASILTSFRIKSTRVRGSITTKPIFQNILDPHNLVHDAYDILHWRSLFLEFVSNDLDSNGKLKTVKTSAYYHYCGGKSNFQFDIPEDFGEIGAVLVDNQYRNEIFLEKIVLDDMSLTITCNSWLHTKNEYSDRRIFFTNKSYLPSDTPKALKSLREQDLVSLRGDGLGERKYFERIYDYNVYNDLGDPEKNSVLVIYHQYDLSVKG